MINGLLHYGHRRDYSDKLLGVIDRTLHLHKYLTRLASQSAIIGQNRSPGNVDSTSSLMLGNPKGGALLRECTLRLI